MILISDLDKKTLKERAKVSLHKRKEEKSLLIKFPSDGLTKITLEFMA